MIAAGLILRLLLLLLRLLILIGLVFLWLFLLLLVGSLQQRFEIPADQEPADLSLDPNTWILMATHFGRK